MRRSRIGALVSALALMMAMTIPAGAADLHEPHKGSSCGPGEIGVWHFVNNQTGGAPQGTITAIFDGNVVVMKSADKVNKNNQHFTITGAEGSPYTSLVNASTNLPGKLVLSDFTCEAKKDNHEDGKK